MALREAPIAVFDSGVGGISVLKELIRQMPGENYLYYGDSANAPYGDRSTQQVRTLTLQAAEMLFSKRAKALVVACNTATSAAIGLLRETYPDKVIVGIEPALKLAADRFPGGRIGVMATQVTLREEKFAHQMERFPNVQVELIPAPGLVQLIEAGNGESEDCRRLLERILGPFRGELDALVLGCTHYPFAKKCIRQVLGEQIPLLDGGEGTARQTRRLLENAGLLREGAGSLQILNSREDPGVIALCKELLNKEDLK